MGDVIQNIFRQEDEQLEQIEESVFSAAYELARISSIENVEINHILNRAQVSRNTFKKLYSTAEELYKKLGQRLTNETFSHYIQYLAGTQYVPKRVANKTKLALQVIARVPFFSQLALRAEWPSSDPRHIMYKDVEKDIREGIEQGYFSDMPPAVGVSIVLGCLRGATRNHYQGKQSEGYIDQAVFQVLISLGLDQDTAHAISKAPVSDLPSIPSKGLVSKVFSIERLDKNDSTLPDFD